MNTEKYFEDPLANGSQMERVVAHLKSEIEFLRATITKMNQRPRERRISIYEVSEGMGEAIVSSLTRKGAKEMSDEESETDGKPLELDFSSDNLWNTILDNYGRDEFLRDYREWKEENAKYSFDDLKARQKQEVFKLLTSNFFRYYCQPTGAAVKNRRLLITEDDLEMGTQIPKMLASECAKFEKFLEWRGEHIMIIDYGKLEYYIRKNQNLLTSRDMTNIAAFDMCLDRIQEDMIELRPEEAKNHKNYETNNTLEILNECAAILNTCQHLLKDGIRKSIMKEFLDKMLFDEKMKDEARRKLGKKTRAKFLCEILAAISNCYIFKPEATFGEFAKCLRQKIKTIEMQSIKSYIVKAAGNRQCELQQYTTASIAELKDNPYNPFAGILTD